MSFVYERITKTSIPAITQLKFLDRFKVSGKLKSNKLQPSRVIIKDKEYWSNWCQVHSFNNKNKSKNYPINFHNYLPRKFRLADTRVKQWSGWGSYSGTFLITISIKCKVYIFFLIFETFFTTELFRRILAISREYGC